MIETLPISSLPVIFFSLVVLSVLSALLLLFPRVSMSYIRIHLTFIALPPIAALLGVFFNKENTMIGPWRFDSLSWLLAAFVLTVGFVVQRYCVRYLYGDSAYKNIFCSLHLQRLRVH